jgi:glutamyl-tRNA reductase
MVKVMDKTAVNILLIGVNHKTAPIQIREKISFSSECLPQALLRLKSYDSIEEDVILSTCNRVEIYATGKSLEGLRKSIWDFIADFHKIKPQEFENYFYEFKGTEAVRHLFKVVSSLDSMVIGEPQIFGQVKESYFKACEYKTIKHNLRNIFEEAIKTGKKIRSETKIGKGAVSMSSAAIELVKKTFNDFEGKKILIIGTGKIGELAVRDLYLKGASKVLVANRTFHRACELARNFNGIAIKWQDILKTLINADIVVSSTSAKDYLIEKEDLERIMQKRKNRTLFLIDLGLPRNIDPKASHISNLHLYNIDDLHQVRFANLNERLSQVKNAERIIEDKIKRL